MADSMPLGFCCIRSLMCFHAALVISLASIHAHTVCVYEPRRFADFPRFPRAALLYRSLCVCLCAHKCARECFQASLHLRVEAENNVYVGMWRPEEDVRGSFFSLFLYSSFLTRSLTEPRARPASPRELSYLHMLPTLPPAP